MFKYSEKLAFYQLLRGISSEKSWWAPSVGTVKNSRSLLYNTVLYKDVFNFSRKKNNKIKKRQNEGVKMSQFTDRSW